MNTFPTTPGDAVATTPGDAVATATAMTATIPAEFRAGGTDVQERRRTGISTGPVVDIHLLHGFSTIDWDEDGSARIGTLVTIDAVARDPGLNQHYRGLAQAAGGLATPQIRWMSTMGGALLQRTRCAYYRHPAFHCYKNGGDACYARTGHNPNGVVFDRGACVYPHPSTLGMALLTYEAEVEIFEQGRRSVFHLYGSGADPTRDHMLEAEELLTQIVLPPPTPGERTAYFRAISRAEAEWPIVECLARLVVEDETIRMARVGAGGVATVPLRLTKVEAALEGQPATQSTLERAAHAAAEGTNPLPQTVGKVDFLVGTVLETLERAMEN